MVEDFSFEAPKTKEFTAILAALKLQGKKVLLLTGAHQEAVYKAGRNIHKVQILEVAKASTYDILNNQILLVQKSAVDYLNSAYEGRAKEEVANA